MSVLSNVSLEDSVVQSRISSRPSTNKENNTGSMFSKQVDISV